MMKCKEMWNFSEMKQNDDAWKQRQYFQTLVTMKQEMKSENLVKWKSNDEMHES